MITARPVTFLPLLTAILPLSIPALAAPVPLTGAPLATSLSFDVIARVGTTGLNGAPEQTVEAKVLLRGGAARVESSSGGTRSVVLFAPPYIYRLLPDSKAGVRWKVEPRQNSPFTDLDPQQLLREPLKIKAALLKSGAIRIGGGALAGVPVEIYRAKNFGARGQSAKVWLRRSDSLPLRLESSGAQFKITASWRNYARPKLSAALFSAPPGFKIRTLSGAPSLGGF